MPSGRWGVGVSGGADSVALIRLLTTRSDLDLHVIHLDHQTRNGQSGQDAEFVRELSRHLGLSVTVVLRSLLEKSMVSDDLRRSATATDTNRTPSGPTDHGDGGVRTGGTGDFGQPKTSPPLANGIQYPTIPSAIDPFYVANRSAYFRSLRHLIYQQAVVRHSLRGVLLAHHADDQAETILLRLLRGAGFAALTGMKAESKVGDLSIVRPLLGFRQTALRHFLTGLRQSWREDASNASDDYARNRVRKVLADQPRLVAALLIAGQSCASARAWVTKQVPHLADRFRTADVSCLPDVLVGTAVATWLQRQGVDSDAAVPIHVAAIVRMCRDAASPARHAAPGPLNVRRRGGEVWGERG